MIDVNEMKAGEQFKISYNNWITNEVATFVESDGQVATFTQASPITYGGTKKMTWTVRLYKGRWVFGPSANPINFYPMSREAGPVNPRWGE